MDWLFLLGVAAALLFLFLPKKAKLKNPKPGRRYRGSGAVLFGINEVFQPSAANAQVVLEEKREARKASPSPEDKPN